MRRRDRSSPRTTSSTFSTSRARRTPKPTRSSTPRSTRRWTRHRGRPVVLWFAFGSIFGVWNVFQSPGLDFRLIALGALLPLVLDAPFGAQAYAHTLLSAVIVLIVAMALTAGRGHRLRRRRALSFAIGWFAGLVLSAS